mgnify:CR=1 FL=1|jgi:ferrous-iron efflux pump FieF
MAKSATGTATTETRGDPARRGRLLRLATTWSVATAAVLIGVKTAASVYTGSVSMVASLVDSLMDALASLVNFFAVRFALAPPDEEHRFGHGKAEALAGVAQAAFIAGSAAFLALQAFDRLLQPRALENVGAGLAVMAFSIAATLLLLAVQRHVIRQTGSVAIRADSLHYVTDLLANFGVIVALLAASGGFPRADGLFALLVAAWILWSAWQIGVSAVQTLLDRELPEQDQVRILDIARAHPEVEGAHDLRTRQAGAVRFIQLHLELRPDMPLLRAHAIADQVSAELRQVFPGADVIIHQDPAGLPEADREPWRRGDQPAPAE